MFQTHKVLFIHTESSLHVGSGRSLGAVDLPIQRERTTGYPMVQASSLKGKLRALADPRQNPRSPLSDAELEAVFGPDTLKADEHAGALAVGDAQLLLFPVRSLAGVFAWATSVNALARWRRIAALAGVDVTLPDLAAPEADKVLVGTSTLLKAGESVVLEEFSFAPVPRAEVEALGQWLAQKALPAGPEYEYWRRTLPQRLCILPDDAFRDFCLHATEVQTHVRLDPGTKTVASGALFTSESLPADSLLYAPLLASPSRKQEVGLDAAGVMAQVEALLQAVPRAQLGGDETTGQGLVAWRLAGGAQ